MDAIPSGDASPPTRSTAAGPVPRVRAALLLLVLALVVLMVAGLVVSAAAVADPLLVFGLTGVGAAVLALAAAVAAPVGVGPRVVVIALALVNGGAGLWVATLDDRIATGLPTLASALTGPLQVPALAWLGAALATGLGDRVRRSWRTAVLLTGVIAGLQVLLSVVAVGTSGAAFRFTGGFTTYVVVANALTAAATVAMVHVVVSAHRTWRALDGHPPPRLRPWLLAVTLAVAIVVSTIMVLLSETF